MCSVKLADVVQHQVGSTYWCVGLFHVRVGLFGICLGQNQFAIDVDVMRVDCFQGFVAQCVMPLAKFKRFVVGRGRPFGVNQCFCTRRIRRHGVYQQCVRRMVA